MNKIHIIIYVPLLAKNFEMFVPINKKVGTIKKIVVDEINELSNFSINKIESLMLYDKETNKIIDNNFYIKNSGLSNGSILILL